MAAATAGSETSMKRDGARRPAPLNGKWRGTKGFGTGGRFSGVFEVPFRRGEASRTAVCYLENGIVIPADKPLVKLVVTFFNN
jgi:hypothetical protein